MTISREYHKKYNKSLMKVIDSEFSGDIKKLIKTVLYANISPSEYFATRINIAVKGLGTNEKILKRFHSTYKEINEVTKYNYVVVNDVVETAVEKVNAIINAEKCRVDRIEEVYLDTKEEEIHELLMNDEFDNSGLGDKI